MDLDQMLIWMLKSRSSDQSIIWFEIFWSYPHVSRCHDRKADINIRSSGLEGDQPHHKYGSERKEIWDKSIRQAVDQRMRGLTSIRNGLSALSTGSNKYVVPSESKQFSYYGRSESDDISDGSTK